MPRESDGLLRLQALAVLAALVLAHGSLSPFVADADSFYHLGHAAHYAQAGLFDTSFPWATASAIGDLGGDLWWGYHVVLVPFTAFSGVVSGIHAAAFVSSALLAAAFWWALARHGVPGAGWWTALFLVAVPNVLYRYLMLRPHVLSLGLAILLLSFLARGRWWHVLLLSAAMAWLHLGVFWMAPGLVAAFAAAGALLRDSPATGSFEPSLPASGTRPVAPLAAAAAVVGGTAAGALLRPNPGPTLELAWIQIVRLFAEKGADLPLLFAAELHPLGAGELLRSSWSFLLVLAAAVAAWGWRARREEGRAASWLPERRLACTALLVAAAFLALTLGSARRALVEFVAFGFLTLPLVWTYLVPPAARRRVLPAAGVLLAVHLAWGGQRHLLNARYVADPPDRLAEAAAWLAANTEPGDVVFHAHWDEFGPLFAHNRHNRYIGGMDPIFQFSHDPGLYWQYFFLSAGVTSEYTCDAFPCYEGETIGTWAAIRDNFGARWVLVEPARNPELARFLGRDPGFRLALRTRRELVFEVLGRDHPHPPAGATPATPS